MPASRLLPTRGQIRRAAKYQKGSECFIKQGVVYHISKTFIQRSSSAPLLARSWIGGKQDLLM